MSLLAGMLAMPNGRPAASIPHGRCSRWAIIRAKLRTMLYRWGCTVNFTIGSPEAVGCSSQHLARITPVMQSYVDQRGFAGISTMLARRGHVVHFEQVGWQDRESHTPLSADAIYRIYSMTKPIVCVALM